VAAASEPNCARYFRTERCIRTCWRDASPRRIRVSPGSSLVRP
jgi:hypothetical protein